MRFALRPALLDQRVREESPFAANRRFRRAYPTVCGKSIARDLDTRHALRGNKA